MICFYFIIFYYKKIVACILLCLFLCGNTAFAKDESKEVLLLKTKIENLKQEIKVEEKVQKKQLKVSKKYDELGDSVLKLIELEWNNISIDDISWEGKEDNSNNYSILCQKFMNTNNFRNLRYPRF